jgi:hypothetical protein
MASLSGLIKGFNSKEQQIFNKLKDGEPHDIRDLKLLFMKKAEEHCGLVFEEGWGEAETDAQAQSFVRNSVRRLVRDGWVEQSARGTYRMSNEGFERIKKGITETPSFAARIERKMEIPKGRGKKKPHRWVKVDPETRPKRKLINREVASKLKPSDETVKEIKIEKAKHSKKMMAKIIALLVKLAEEIKKEEAEEKAKQIYKKMAKEK